MRLVLVRLYWGVSLLCVCLASCDAQELVPRAYVIAPTHWNAVNVSYSSNVGTVLFDGSVPITSATSNVSALTISYTHAFGFFGRTAAFTAALPYSIGNAQGLVFDVPKSSHLSGLLPAIFRLSANLRGGPAMNAEEFKRWHQKTIIGASFLFVPPTGQYDPTKLINLGSNRWSFRAEVGYSRRMGHWIVDGYGGIWAFTTNPEFFSHDQFFPGTNTLSQSPIGEFDAHLSYDFRPGLWVSLNGNFWHGGGTNLNGAQSPGTLQTASRVGLTSAIPLNKTQAVKVMFSRGTYVRYPGNYTSIGVGWQYSWIGRP
jgi:hypothetical protein